MKSSRINIVVNDDLVFDVIDSGPIDGEPLILLHGFPQTGRSWSGVATHLHRRGFRTFAPTQRGYSPFAFPRGRIAYRMSSLAGDVVALMNEIAAPSVHLAGHDWGAAVAWSLASSRPARVRTLTTVSVPHTGAFLRSMLTSDQVLRSYYMGLFQIPWVPELVLRRNPSMFAQLLRDTGMSPEEVKDVKEEILDNGALTGAINWYRAMPFANPLTFARKVSVPTTHVWGTKDTALSRRGAELTARYVTGDYEFAEIPGATHWIPTQNAEALADIITHRAMSFHAASAACPGTAHEN
ncbi:alpha/beta fold hydrolase [Hoyosella sp. YIM 151337]|uniref:alpha/beta fold hydrolase n=1 Tax=Hoyosella sp. YIM 151337 TaxID=2992742 RepID=UPI002235D95D|nr:alpha/beta fold hydrolase [Hoyosella sp. YIM 151337]MCW4351719.1 alpha/beta fold hydrolase [Hoyosella sp. YIM 151337]